MLNSLKILKEIMINIFIYKIAYIFNVKTFIRLSFKDAKSTNFCILRVQLRKFNL